MNAFRTTAPGDAGSGFRPRVLLISADRGAGGVVARTLQASGRFGMIGEAVSVDEAVQVAPTVAPDVVLLELPPSTPAVEGALRPLRDCVPAAKMVIWTSGELAERGFEALRAGAAGFIGRELDRDALVRTLVGVAAGEAAVSRGFATWLIARVREEPERRLGMRPVKSRLTTREWEVFDLFSAGISKPAIARDLRVTIGTVRSHLRSLGRKLSIDVREPAAGGSDRQRAPATD